jgi:hypothetical protein
VDKAPVKIIDPGPLQSDFHERKRASSPEEAVMSKPKCPSCGSEIIIPILYGLPSSRTWELVKQGKCVLGGCEVDDSNPDFFCKDCGHSFGATAKSTKRKRGDEKPLKTDDKSKGIISLTMIRHLLTPEQKEALDKMDESTLSEIIGMANDFPDGLNWVIQHFWLIHDQGQLL